jgi:hypothetical protein
LLFAQLLWAESDQLSRRRREVRADAKSGRFGSSVAIAFTMLRSGRRDGPGAEPQSLSGRHYRFSSWSHAFLHDKAWRLYPDVESDRAFYEALRGGQYSHWRETSLEAVEESGQQEMLNWFCLAGAMAELKRTPSWSVFIESYLFNSNKCFAVFPGLNLATTGGLLPNPLLGQGGVAAPPIKMSRSLISRRRRGGWFNDRSSVA